MSAAAPRKNNLQALLQQQLTPTPGATPAPAPQPEASEAAASEPVKKAAKPAKFTRPSRTGTKFVGGHFDPKVAKAMRLMAAEDDTSIQALLEEAIDLLFVKKGKGRVIKADASEKH